MTSRRTIRVLASVVAVLTLVQPVALRAQDRSDRHVLRAADYDARTFIPPQVIAPGKTAAPSLTINVSYTGFPSEAREAFEYAVSLWEQYLSSPVTVQVDATFEPLEEDVLGSAGPRLTANFGPTAAGDTWYPTAIADAVSGRNVDSGNADIVASFNSEFERWYFGLDGRPPSGQYDFVTVVLHELGHGLGFTGSFDVEDDDDEVDECATDDVGAGCWGIRSTTGRQRYPMIYDRFVEDIQEVSLLNTSIYPNPSQQLGAVLQSGQVFFDGASVRMVHGDVPVDLYAPETFERGSSFSHLDERQFPPGDPNSLMTPFLAAAEAIHNPGPVACAVLQDLGWPMGDGCLSLFFDGIASATVEVRGDGAVVSFEVAPGAGIDSVIIEVGRTGEDSEPVAVVDVDAGAQDVQQFEVELPGLDPGQYIVYLRIVSVDQVVLPGPNLTVAIPLVDRYQVGHPYPNPVRDLVRFTLMVREEQPVTVEVYDAQGRRTATLLTGTMSRNQEIVLAQDVRQWAAGTYFILVKGRDFRASRSFVRIR